MLRLMKLSLFNVKNVIRSRKFMLFIIAAFAYSMLWIFMVHPKAYDLPAYGFEFSRFLYVGMLYASTLILQNDMKANTVKTLFSGVFTRTEVMISKAIALVMLGISFSLIVEANNLFTALILHEKIGISGFLGINHFQVFITYVGITFSMGWMLILLVSIVFSEKKGILAWILLMGTVNFYNSGLIVLISRKPEVAQKVSAYLKTPFYMASDLMMGNFAAKEALMITAYGMMFFILSAFIMNKREIK